jgi:Ca2+/H+ antiporter, TMEM165/GDT1 family
LSASVLLGTFLAATIEVIEMVAIVVAVGADRSWRGSLIGAAAGLVALVLLLAALGAALHDVPLRPLRLVAGTLLLVFGAQWLRKGVLRVSRDGWRTGVGEPEDIDGPPPPASGLDWTAVVLSFKGTSLEGLEVVVIAIAFGASAGAMASAAVGAAAAVVVVGALGALAYRFVARIPRRALQLAVGAMLTAFGTFWCGEGLEVGWPGGELALLWLVGGYLAVGLALLHTVSDWRRRDAAALGGPGSSLAQASR